MSEQKPSRVRLLENNDMTKLGWKVARQGLRSFINTRGFGLLWVMHQKLKPDGSYADLYDQPMIVENPGALVVLRSADKIGLIQNFRMTGDRLLNKGADYLRALVGLEMQDKIEVEVDKPRLRDLVASLGEWQLECPRGLANVGFEGGLEQFLIATAKREALEEAGCTIANPRLVGKLNLNTTFFMHSQYVVAGDVIAVGDAQPEDLEVIGGLKFYSRAEIRKLVNDGKLVDGATLAALAAAGYHF